MRYVLRNRVHAESEELIAKNKTKRIEKNNCKCNKKISKYPQKTMHQFVNNVQNIYQKREEEKMKSNEAKIAL